MSRLVRCALESSDDGCDAWFVDWLVTQSRFPSGLCFLVALADRAVGRATTTCLGVRPAISSNVGLTLLSLLLLSFLLLLLLLLIPGGGAICTVDGMHHRVESSSRFPWMMVLLFFIIVTFSSSNIHLHPASHKIDIDNNDRSISANTCAMRAFVGRCGRYNNFVAIDRMILLLAHFTSSGWCSINSPGWSIVMKWPVAAVSGWSMFLLVSTVCRASCFNFLDGSDDFIICT